MLKLEQQAESFLPSYIIQLQHKVSINNTIQSQNYYAMKIDLSRDPLFQQKQSPAKDFKERQREKHKHMRSLRINPINQKSQLNVEIVDPLPEELHKYRHEIEYKKTFQSSKASQKLKKYIIEQERNLKCVRLEKIDLSNEILDSSRAKHATIKIDMNSHSASRAIQKQKDDKLKQINIPKIEDLFKNQQKQYVLYQSRMMRNQLTKAIGKIDAGVTKLKSFSAVVSNGHSANDTRKSTATDRDRFPSVSYSVGEAMNIGVNNNGNNGDKFNEEDYEIDKLIEKKLSMSKKLRDRLYREKKQILTHQAKESSQSKNISFFLNIPKKPKKKVMLEGVKSITFCEGDQKWNITPASSLLFSLNKMSKGRDKKQIELQGLIQNSFQNREAILFQKSNFYDQETPFNNLSPSNQFKLRQLMDKKLMHRLELSKEQVNNFISYLTQIKQYHVILNETILQILKQVRLMLLSGKVMKTSDLQGIIEKQPKSTLVGYPNELILQKLHDMMI